MTLLQIFFILSGIIILILSYTTARKERFSAIHFLVFLLAGFSLEVFAFFPSVLDELGSVFGIARGADALVYISIIFLFYFSLLLLRKVEDQKVFFTEVVRNLALSSAHQKHTDDPITIVIPAYNEVKRIESVLSDLRTAGYRSVIVVDDGSRDGTSELLDHLAHEHHHLSVIHHVKNLGQGAALETAFEYIRRWGTARFIVTFDADGQHAVEDISRFVASLEDHPRTMIALGSRFLEKQHHASMPTMRRLILKAGILFTFLISGIRLSDTHNGFRVFRRELLEYLSLSMNGMEHASEFLDIIAEKDIAYQELPTCVRYDAYSLEKGQKSSNAWHVASRMIWKKFFR